MFGRSLRVAGVEAGHATSWRFLNVRTGSFNATDDVLFTSTPNAGLPAVNYDLKITVSAQVGTLVVVREPVTVALFISGLAGLGWAMRSRNSGVYRPRLMRHLSGT